MTFLYLQCPFEKVLLRSEVPELHVGDCQVVQRPRNFSMMLSVVLVFDHQCPQEHLLHRVGVLDAAFEAAQVLEALSLQLGMHGERPLLKSIFTVGGEAQRDADRFRRNLRLLSILVLLGELPEGVPGFRRRVGDERSEGSQLTVIARCRDCLVSFPKAIEEARHWSELPLLHGAAVTKGPSPPSVVKQRFVSSRQKFFFAVRVDVFDRDFEGEDIYNHRVVDLGLATAPLARNTGAHCDRKERWAEVRREAMGVPVS